MSREVDGNGKAWSKDSNFKIVDRTTLASEEKESRVGMVLARHPVSIQNSGGVTLVGWSPPKNR